MSEKWIFGGSKPLGLAIHKVLAEDGKVVSFSRSEVKVEGLNAESVVADLGDLARLREIVQDRFPIDTPLGVVFCQRFRPDDGLDDLEALKQGIDIELAPVLLMLEEHKKIASAEPLSIVLLSSVAGLSSHPDVPIWYHLLKAITIKTTKLLASRHAGEGVRVNCVVLGEFEKYPRESYTDEERRKFDRLENYSLDKRICSKTDIAQLVQFLLSDKAAFISGQVISLDGTLSELSQESIIRAALGEGQV